MKGAVTPETCRVILQENKLDCILLHLVGFSFNINIVLETVKQKEVSIPESIYVAYIDQFVYKTLLFLLALLSVTLSLHNVHLEL